MLPGIYRGAPMNHKAAGLGLYHVESQYPAALYRLKG